MQLFARSLDFISPNIAIIYSVHNYTLSAIYALIKNKYS